MCIIQLPTSFFSTPLGMSDHILGTFVIPTEAFVSKDTYTNLRNQYAELEKRFWVHVINQQANYRYILNYCDSLEDTIQQLRLDVNENLRFLQFELEGPHSPSPDSVLPVTPPFGAVPVAAVTEVIPPVVIPPVLPDPSVVPIPDWLLYKPEETIDWDSYTETGVPSGPPSLITTDEENLDFNFGIAPKSI